MSSIIGKIELERAYSRIAPYISHTPLLFSTFLSERWQAEVYLKCEQFQNIGAFKIRGASNFFLQLSEEERKKGIVTHSSGNHAQAVAYMAYKLECIAYIVMPHNSNKLKIENTKKWGAELVFCEPNLEDRLRQSERIADEKGAHICSPFDHKWIIEGQATAAMEIIRENKDIELIITPLGGGGLLSGTAMAAHYFSPNTDVIGAEPVQAADGYRGFKSGVRELNPIANTVADGLRTAVGKQPFDIIQQAVKDIWLAEEKDIIPWMYRIWQESKILIEASSAVPFAAMDGQSHELKGKKVAVIISGGNVDLTAFAKP